MEKSIEGMVYSWSNSRYTYVSDCKSKWSLEEHHIVVRQNAKLSNPFLRNFWALLILLPFASFYLFPLLQGGSNVMALLSFVLFGVVLKLSLWKTVVKESVVIMPSFGVQLETRYLGGKVSRSFIPADKILKPLLVERVTPVTCYWSLSLVLREEDELALVFKRLRPPVKMLVPIWRSLCAAINKEESSSTFAHDSQR